MQNGSRFPRVLLVAGEIPPQWSRGDQRMTVALTSPGALSTAGRRGTLRDHKGFRCLRIGDSSCALRGVAPAHASRGGAAAEGGEPPGCCVSRRKRGLARAWTRGLAAGLHGALAVSPKRWWRAEPAWPASVCPKPSRWRAVGGAEAGRGPCVAQLDATQGHGRVHLDEEAGAHLLERPRALEANGGEARATERAGPGEAAEAGTGDEDVAGGLGGYNQPLLYADCRSAPSGPV